MPFVRYTGVKDEPRENENKCRIDNALGKNQPFQINAGESQQSSDEQQEWRDVPIESFPSSDAREKCRA